MAFGDVRGTLNGGATSIPAGGAMATSAGSSSVSIGDLIVAVVAETGANTVTGVTDNLGHTYTAQNAGTLSSVGGRMFWFIATVAGTLSTVTGSGTASGDDFAIVAAVFAGPFRGPPDPHDVSPANATDATSPFTCPATGTLSQASELIVNGFVATRGQTNTAATSPNLLAVNKASSTANAASSCHAAIGSQVVASTSTISPAFTCASGTFNGCVEMTMSFEAPVNTAKAVNVSSIEAVTLSSLTAHGSNISVSGNQSIAIIRRIAKPVPFVSPALVTIARPGKLFRNINSSSPQSVSTFLNKGTTKSINISPFGAYFGIISPSFAAVSRTGLTGAPATSPRGVYSTWFNYDRINTNLAFMQVGGALSCMNFVVAGGLCSIDLFDNTNTDIVSSTFNVGPGYNQHFLISWDTSTQKISIALNGKPVAYVLAPIWSSTNDVAGFTTGQLKFVNDQCYGNGEFYLDLGTYYDLTNPTNVSKWWSPGNPSNPVNLGANGQNPSGSSPLVYLHIGPNGSANDILTNLGTGGNMTLTSGTISLGPSFGGFGLTKNVGKSRSIASAEKVSLAAVKVSGANFPQAIAMVSTQAVALSRQISKTITVAQSQAIALARSIVRAISLVGAQAVAVIRQIAHAVLLASPESVSISETAGHPISVNLSSSESLSLTRGTGKNVIISSTQAVNLTRAIGKMIIVAQSTALALLRNIGKFIIISSTEVVSLFRSLVRSILITSASALTLTRSIGKLLNVQSSQFISISRKLGKLISVAISQAVSLVRAFGKLISIVEAQAVSLVTGKAFFKTNTIASPSSLTLVRVVGKIVNLTDGQLVTLARSMGKLVQVAQTQAVSLARSIGKFVSVSQAQAVSLVRARTLGKSLTISSPEVVALNRGIGRLITASSPQVITMSRAIGKTIVVVSLQAVSLVRAVAKTIMAVSAQAASLLTTKNTSGHTLTFNLVSPEAVSLLRQTGKFIQVAQTQAVSLTRRVGHAITVAQAQLVSLIRSVGKLLGIVSPESVSLTRSRTINKAINVSSSEHVTLARQIGKLISLIQAQALNLSRQAGRLIFIASIQTISLTRSVFKRLTILSSQLVTLTVGRAFTKTITVSSSEHVTLTRQVGKLISVVQTQVVFVSRAIGKTITTGSPQLVSLTKDIGKFIGVVLTQLVDLSTTGKAKFQSIHIISAQSLTVTTLISKSFQMVSSSALTLTNMVDKSFTFVSGQIVILGRGLAVPISLVQSQTVSVVTRFLEHLIAVLEYTRRFAYESWVAWMPTLPRDERDVAVKVEDSYVLMPPPLPLADAQNVAVRLVIDPGFYVNVFGGPMPFAVSLPPVGPNQEQTCALDFGLLLPPGVTLTGTPTVTITVSSGTDPTPQSRLTRAGQVGTASKAIGGTAVTNAAVLFQVGTCLPGVVYVVDVVCGRSDSDIAEGSTRFSCLAPS